MKTRVKRGKARPRRWDGNTLTLPEIDLAAPAADVSVHVEVGPAFAIPPRPDNFQPDPIPELRGETEIILDGETFGRRNGEGLRWWDGARPAGWAWMLPQSGRKGYLSFGHEGGYNTTDEPTAKRWMEREIRGMHIENANTRFDMHISRSWGVDLAEQGNTFGDVQHRAALLDDHRLRLNIDLLAHDFLGPERGKLLLPPGAKERMNDCPSWMVAPYAVEDVQLVHDLNRAMQPDLEAQELLEVLKLEQQIIPVVVEMEHNGVFLDVEKLFAWRDAAQREYDELLERIYKVSGVRVSSPDSNKDLAAMFRARGIPITNFTDPTERHPEGQPSFTADVMKRAAVDDPCVADAYYAAQLGDLLSKYLRKFCNDVRQSDGWMRFNLHQLRIGKDHQDKFGTVSGRFSSAGDKEGGFNVQQVVSPKKQKDKDWCQKYVIRNLFKPAAGTQWLAVDASQIEYRIFAHFANDPDIMAAYNEDVPEEIAIKEKRGRWTDYHDKVQVMLQRAKPDIPRKHTKITNFCKLFGASIIKFAYTLETISDKQFKDLEAKYDVNKWRKKEDRFRRMSEIRKEPCLQSAIEVFDLYDQQFPAAAEMLKLAKETAGERGYVRTIMGRRARFPKKQRVHSALNRVVQGTAADINKRVLVEIYRLRKELTLTLRMTVHDEVDADLGDESKLPRIEEVFNHQYIPLRVPILWDAEVGPSWGEAKKKA